MTGLLINYLGRGFLADRPVTPDVAVGALSLYYATDTTPPQMYAWNDVTAAWDSIVTVDAPIDTTPYVRVDGAWASLPAYPDVPNVPAVDGLVYGMKDDAWVRIDVASLADVDLTGLADGFILKYDLATTSWKVAAESGGGGGGGGAIGTHQYWGFLGIQGNNPIQLQAVHWDLAGVTTYPTHYHASTVFGGGYAADNLLDDTGSYWAANQSPAWIYGDFTTPVGVDQIKLKAVAGSEAYAPYELRVAYSDDKLTWIEVATLIYLQGDWTTLAGAFAVFDIPTTR